jgi:hypothetical protein
LSTHTSAAPPPHDVPSICPTKPLPGTTFPHPGSTLRMPSTRTAVQRHTPTPLTPPDPDRTGSKKSRTAAPSSRRVSTTYTGGFSTPSGESSLAALAGPFHQSAATIAPSSAELVYTTATAIPTEIRRTHTDNDDANLPAPPSARFTGHPYVLRRHDKLHVLSRPASTTCLLNLARVRPVAAARPLSAHVPGITTAAQHAPSYKTAALHLYMRRYTSPRQQTFSVRSTPLLLHPPPNREAIAAGNASDLASNFRRENYMTGSLTRNAHTTGITQHLRAPYVLYDDHVGTSLLADLVSYARKPTRPLRLGHSQLVP